jgi:chemotaxis family two-component system sensor kinase Cph1
MVSSFVQLLADRSRGQLDEDAQEFIHFAVEGATRMHELINALLAYSRLDMAAAAFTLVDSQAALDCALENLKVSIEESSALITHGPLPRVPGDVTQIVQLFQNVVGNAIKFRKQTEPPRVHVAAELRGDEWQFSVADNGIGLDPKHGERIFVNLPAPPRPERIPGHGNRPRHLQEDRRAASR